MKMSLFWRNVNHWLHWKFSSWQLPVPVMKISSNWRRFRFSELMWRRMSVYASNTRATRLFIQPLVLIYITEKIIALYYWTFVWEIHRWRVDSLHNVPLVRKELPCLDVIMMKIIRCDNCLAYVLSPQTNYGKCDFTHTCYDPCRHAVV